MKNKCKLNLPNQSKHTCCPRSRSLSPSTAALHQQGLSQKSSLVGWDAPKSITDHPLPTTAHHKWKKMNSSLCCFITSSPALHPPSKATEEGNLQSPGFKSTTARVQGHPDCCHRFQAHLCEWWLLPMPIPALPPPEIQISIPGMPRTECHGSLCFPTKQPLSHSGNCGELPMGRSRDSYPLSLHFLTSAHPTSANTERPNPA